MATAPAWRWVTGGGLEAGLRGHGLLQGQTTASGVPVRAGIAAADPKLLPIGSVVQVGGSGVAEAYRGIYTVLDTGPKVQGRHVDLYMWSCTEARRSAGGPVDADGPAAGLAPERARPIAAA